MTLRKSNLRFAALLSCFLLGVPTAAQHRRSDKEHEGLVGPVKTLRVEVASLSTKAGLITENKRAVSREAAFNEDGTLVQEYTRDRSNGRLVRHIYGQVKDDNRTELLIKPGYTPVDAYPNAMLISHQLEYDEEGKRTEEKFFTEGTLAYKNVYTYQADGKPKEVSQYGADGGLVRKYVYGFSSKGYIHERSSYNQDGSIGAKEGYSYTDFDADGNWIKRITCEWNEKQSVFEPKEVTYRTLTYWSGVSSSSQDLKPQASGQQEESQQKSPNPHSSEYPVGKATVRVQPKYSLASRKVGGTVVVQVTIDEAGSVVTAKVINLTIRKPITMTEADARHYGQELEKSSLDAAMQWKFEPVRVHGSPMKVIGSITFSFHQ